MSWKVHETDEVFAALRGLCSNSYRMYDPSEHRYYYDHECDAYECVVEDAAEEYQRLLDHCDRQREQLKAWGNVPTLRKIMEDGMDNIGTEVERIEGSSITDELRDWIHEAENEGVIFVDETAPCSDIPKLLEIADRIDAEHAEAVADALQLRGEPDRWVELPVDADGVPIRVGDELTNGIDLPAKVRGMALGEDGWTVSSVSFISTRVDQSTLRHVKPDSWVRIIGDAMSFEGDGWYSTRDDAMAALVERCRRLAGERG